MQNEQQSPTPESILKAKLTDKINAALIAGDLQGALVHTGDLEKMIREIASPAVKRKVDVAHSKADVTQLMALARTLCHAPGDLYDKAYKDLERFAYDLIAKQSWARDYEVLKAQMDERNQWKFSKCIDTALQEPSLAKAVSYACQWEHERALEQARKNNFASWDTCFGFIIYEVTMAWMKRERSAPR